MQITPLSLYFISGTQDIAFNATHNAQDRLFNVLERALISGITCFQLREKSRNALKNPLAIKNLAMGCLHLCQQYQVPFFINDDVHLALEIGADGIHVGQDDTPIKTVVEQCAGKLLIGLTINTLEQAIAEAYNNQIDYYGVGPIYPTQSKADANAIVGVKLIQQIREHGINKSLVAIGGITANNLEAVRKAGADGIAMISSITKDNMIENNVAKLLPYTTSTLNLRN